MKKSAFIFLAALILSGGAIAAETRSFFQEAQAAWQKGQSSQANFWLVRHLSQFDFASDEDADALLKEMRLEPKGFIPVSWPEPVIQWFVERGRSMWKTQESQIHPESSRFEVAQAAADDYFAVLTVVPEIQAWYRVENGVSTKRELLGAGAARPAPTLAFGRRISGSAENQPTTVFRFFSVWALHHGALSFRDLDGDKTPELVVRLTWLVSNGFRQTVRLYRILPSDRLELWKTLDAPTGSFLGVGPDGTPQPISAEDFKESQVTDLFD